MRAFNFTSLHWAFGSFCLLVGALMLVAPHQFDAPGYAPIRPQLGEWGALFLAAGGGVVLSIVLRHRVLVAVAAHLMAAVALIALAYGFLLTANWTGAIAYGVFGLGLAISALLLGLRPVRARSTGQGDVFVILIGISSTLQGMVMLAIPDQFSAARY